MDDHAPHGSFGSGLKRADFEAWRDLYAQCGGLVYRLARGMVGQADAEDVVQETFLQAFRKRAQFRGRTAREFESWLCRIALNKCKDWCRQRQCRPVLVAAPDLAAIGSAAAPMENRLDDIDLLQEGLQGVPPQPRALLLLHLAGRSYREIGKILKIKSKATVSERLGAARMSCAVRWPGLDGGSDMHCDKVRRLMSAYFDTELPADMRSAVRQHTQRCADCRDALDSLRNLAPLFRAWDNLQSPAPIWDALAPRLRTACNLAMAQRDDEAAANNERVSTQTPARPSFKPFLEGLEDRQALSAVFCSSVPALMSGSVTAPAAVVCANTHGGDMRWATVAAWGW